MMDEKLLLKLLEDVMTVADAAYWGNRKHCNSSIEVLCSGCTDFPVCRAQVKFKNSINILKEVNKL